MMGLDAMEGVSQFVIKRRPDRSVTLVLAKMTDHLLFAGSIYDMNASASAIKERFDISKAIIDGPIQYNGCRNMMYTDGHREMSMEQYVQSIDSWDMTRETKEQHDEKASRHEYDAYRSLAASIIWAGNVTVPYASSIGSFMQQTATRLRVGDLTEPNKMLK